MDHIERTRLPRQWISRDVELLKLKVGGDWAIVGGRFERELVRKSPSGTTSDTPRTHWTDVYCGHLGIGKFLCSVD